MFHLTIQEKGGETRTETFDKAEVTIGRVQGNDVILPKGNISKRHSRLVYKDDKFVIVDLKSTNGTYVNGKKITAPQVVKPSDKIYIGDFTLQVEADASEEPSFGYEDEIDLFGGKDAAPGREASRSAPRLIEDSFDRDLGGPALGSRDVDGGSWGHREPDLGARETREPVDSPLDLARASEAPDEPGFASETGLEPEPLFEPDAAFEPDPSPPPVAPSARPALAAAPEPEPAPLDPAALSPLGSPDPLDAPAPPRDPGAGSAPPRESAVRATVRPSAAPPPLRRPGADDADDADAADEASVPDVDGGAAFVEPAQVERWLHELVVDELELREVPVADLRGRYADAARAARRHALRLRASGALAADEDVDTIAERVASLATDLGFLAELLADAAVLELVVTPDRQVLVDRDGGFDPAPVDLPSAAGLVDAVRQLAVLGGVDATEVGPVVDVRLRSGARVVATLPPVSFRGPALTVRRPEKDRFDFEKLIQFAALSRPMVALLEACVRFRRPILLCTGPGVSPAATLNAILERLPADDRVVTVENGAELHVSGDRVVTALEPGPDADVETLVALAARLRADRLVVADLRGVASAVFAAASGATAGAAYAMSAASPEDAIARLSSEVEASGHGAAAATVAQCAPIVVHEARFSDGSRRVVRICEVLYEDGRLHAEDVFEFHPDGVDGKGMVTGYFTATGYVPRFIEDLVSRGEADLDVSMFETRG